MKFLEMLGTRLELLRDHTFCAGLDGEQLDRLSERATVRRFAANEYVWRQGESFDQLLLVCEGEISLEISLPLHGPCRIETISAGEIVDSTWLTPGTRWPFDARAVTAVTAVSLPGEVLRTICADHDSLGCELLKRFTAIVGQRLQNNRRRLLDGLQTTRKAFR